MREHFPGHFDVAGIVLAGGESRRMGQEKARLIIGGQPLLLRVVGRLAQAVPRVVVVGAVTLADIVPGVPVLPDGWSACGPLGGLVTALHVAHAAHVCVIGCDMPFVQPALVQALCARAAEATDADVVALRTAAGGLEHLHAVYAVSVLPVVESQLAASDFALHHLFARLRVTVLEPEEAAVFDPAGLSAYNANSPAEWARALTLACSEDADA